MMEQAPSQEIISPYIALHPNLLPKLKKWRPDLDEAQLQLIEFRAVTWNNGSLGCPMPGRNYTQALISGYLFQYFYMGEIIEVHSNSSMSSFAIPGHGHL
jgi:hypothetical protein